MSKAAPEYMNGLRLSPLPGDRKNIIRCDLPATEHQKKSWEEENRRLLRRATKNCGTYLSYPKDARGLMGFGLLPSYTA